MSTKTVYVCDGCKQSILDQPVPVIEGTTRYIHHAPDVYPVGENGHLCSSCNYILNNLIKANLVKVREILQGTQP